MKKQRPAKPAVSPLFMVEGKSACLEQLRQDPEQIERFVFRDNKAEHSFIREAKTSGVWSGQLPYSVEQESAVAVSCQVRITALDYDEFFAQQPEAHPPVLLALDHVTDPRNLGAIVRSAAFFGVSAVLVAKDRQALLTQASVSTAQGGFAATQLVTCTNLARSLTDLKERYGYWVAALDAGGQSIRRERLDFERLVLVLGAEGAGISANIRKKSDLVVSIPGGEAGFDSLNVSVAAGIALFAIMR